MALANSAQQHVHDALRGLHVAAGHRRGRTCFDDTSRGRIQAERSQNAGSGRRIFLAQATQDMKAGRERDGANRVHATRNLWREAGEVNKNARYPRIEFKAHRNLSRYIRHAIVIEPVFALNSPAGIFRSSARTSRSE